MAHIMISRSPSPAPLSVPCAWEVPFQKEPKGRLGNRLSKLGLSAVSNKRSGEGAWEREEAAEMRRNQQLEERRERARTMVVHAKAVAAGHAKRVSEEMTRLREEIARKQADAASRRQMKSQEKHPFKQTVVVPTASDDPQTNLQEDEKEIKSLRAQFRACQRLACVVARTKLHNAKAKLLSTKVRAARQLQRRWRSVLQSIRLVRSVITASSSKAALDFFSTAVPMDSTFETVLEFMNDPRCIKAADVLLVSVNDQQLKEKRKLVLLTQMIVRHPTEILSLPSRKRAVLIFSSKRILRLSGTVNSLLPSTKAGGANLSLIAKTLQELQRSVDSFQVLFKALKSDDADALAEELFEGMVALRVQFEEIKDRSNADEEALERGRFFEQSFLGMLGKVKKLFSNDQIKYKQFIQRVAREVKRRRDELNIVRRLAVDPESVCVQLPQRKAMTEGTFLDLTDEEVTATIVSGLRDIQRRLKAITPNRPVENELDIDLIKQQLDNGVFSFPGDFHRLATAIAERIAFLSELDRAANLMEWVRSGCETNSKQSKRRTIFGVFQRFFGELVIIERDVAQFHMDVLKAAKPDQLLHDHLKDSQAHRLDALKRWVQSPGKDALLGFPEAVAQRLMCVQNSPLKMAIGDEQVFDTFEWNQLRELNDISIKVLRAAYSQLVNRQVLGSQSVDDSGSLPIGLPKETEELLKRLLRAFDEGGEPPLKQLLKRRLQLSLVKRNPQMFLQQCAAKQGGSFQTMVESLHDRFGRLMDTIALSRRPKDEQQ